MDHSGFAPAHSECAFLVYTAQAPGCSAGELSKAGPGWHALPRSKQLRFRFRGTPQRRRLVGPAFCALPRPRSSGDQVLDECTVPGVRCVPSPPRSQLPGFLGAPQEHRLSCAVCLLWGADLRLQPSWQMSPSRIPEDLVSNWEPAHSLVEDAISGAEIASHLLALDVARKGMGWSVAS